MSDGFKLLVLPKSAGNFAGNLIYCIFVLFVMCDFDLLAILLASAGNVTA
jgi:hypothetical protein